MSDSSETATTPPVERINSLQYIRVLLDQMASRCHLVTVTTLDQQVAISAIMRVDGKNREILLDSPYKTDSAAGFEFSNSDMVNISGGNDGSSISFQVEFKEIVVEQGLSLYRFAFPLELSYSAQRATHRVNTRDFDLNISFSASSGYAFEAALCDISDGGLRVRAEKSVIKGLSKGDEIFCKMDIDDGSCNKLKVRLCKPSKTDDPNTIEFGATFVELSAHQKTQISYYIAGLERKLLRKQHAIPESVIPEADAP